MSQKLARLRAVKINDSVYFIVQRKHADKTEKNFADIRREFKRYEGIEVDNIQPVVWNDRMDGSHLRLGDVVEEKEFDDDDLPLVL